MSECVCCGMVSIDFAWKEEFQGYLCWTWVYQGWFGLSGTIRIPFALSWYTGHSKFNFDMQVFLKSVHVKYIWVHIRAHEVSESVTFLLAGP